MHVIEMFVLCVLVNVHGVYIGTCRCVHRYMKVCLYFGLIHFASPDLPSVDLLPPRVISDLRDVAAYYHDSPGENHSGEVI